MPHRRGARQGAQSRHYEPVLPSVNRKIPAKVNTGFKAPHTIAR